MNISGHWTGRITGTNNADIFVEFAQDGAQVNGSVRVNDPVYGTAIYTVSGMVEDKTLQVELCPDMNFFNNRNHNIIHMNPSGIHINTTGITIDLGRTSSYGIITVNAKFQDASSLDGVWESTIGTGGGFFLKRIEAAENQNNRSENSSATKIKKVFVSYSHKDYEYLERLKVHIKPLERQGLVEGWDDTRIKAGDHWKKEIEIALRQAAIAVLMISADFLASDFIIDNELPPLLERAEIDGTKIVPVILKPCRFLRDANLSKFKALNDPDDPVLDMNESRRDALWNNLSQLIEDEIGA